VTDPRLKRALAVIEKLEARLTKAERPEAIAVVGCACRFPGAKSPQELWQGLMEKRCALGPSPIDRWSAESRLPAGGFLNRVDQFDASFFHISPREAESMDPQHRLLLEVTWEALETAGIVPTTLRGSNTGVFVGMGAADYGLKRLYSGDSDSADVYDGTGNTLSFASGRIAFVLGLNGPSLTTATACSSSLVAAHLGAQSLRLKESDLAICSGVSLILEPDNGYFLSSSQALSASGRCRPFDAEADGFVRGEGCGVVLLKRLSDARRDGNHVLAVLKASSVNSDGASAGLTAPNGEAQESLIKQTLRNSGLTVDDIGYVECHGTATNLGDPIEVEALGRAFAQRKSPLSIGSVKANIGHLEGAAGMASLIKALKIIEHQTVPPQIAFQTPNPHVDWDAYPVRVDTQAQNVHPVVGVSGFGMSGTNAHLILAKAEPAEELEPSSLETPSRLQVLVLSARTQQALRDLIGRYIEFPFEPHQLIDICANAALHREHFDHRLAVVANDVDQLKERLSGFLQEGDAAGVWSGQRHPSREPKVAFLFTGQGSQTAGMGAELARLEPSFGHPFRAYRADLEQRIDSLADAWDEPDALDKTVHAQPALVALELALAKLWMDWGVEPAVLFGHSVGEVSAAAVAGIFQTESALELIARRGQSMQALPPGGEMMSVWASASRLEEFLAEHVSVASISGPQLTTLSGPVSELFELESRLAERDIRFKRLPVSHAFHSCLVDPCLEELESIARRAQPGKAEYPLVTGLTGHLQKGEMSQPSYWAQQARKAVRFSTAVETLRKQDIDVFLEIGPKPTLLSQGRQCLPDSKAAWVPSLRPGEADGTVITTALAQLYVAGVKLDWPNVWKGKSYRRVSLPTYPWQYRRFWVDSRRHFNVVQRLRTSGLLTTQELDKVESVLLSTSQSPAPEIPAYQIHWERVAKTPDRAGQKGQQWVLTGLNNEHLEAARTKLNGAVQVTIAKPTAADIQKATRAFSQPRVVFLCQDLNPMSDRPIEALSRCFEVINDVLKGMDSGTLHLLTGPASTLQSTQPIWTQAAIWGFGRALAIEQPSRWGGLLEIDSHSDWNHVVNALGLPQAALRRGQIFTPRLEKVRVPATSVHLDPEKCFLVTGGLGGLGLEIAHTLADLGARRILLLGRTSRPSQRLAELQERGVSVVILLGDISAPETLAELPPIHGVVHAAGFVSDAMVERLTREQYEAVLRPKVQGLQNLATHLKGRSLDFFVVTSSGAALLGNAGQANYGAANAAMSALAGQLREQGFPLSVIHWGAWDIGMTGRLSKVHKDRIKACGFQSFSAGDMSSLLPPLLNSLWTDVLVAKIDWQAFALAFPRRASSDFYPVKSKPVEQNVSISSLVEGELRRILRLDSQAAINPKEGFFQLGLDSLMTSELATLLSQKSGLHITPAAILDHACLEDLRGHLEQLHEAQERDRSGPEDEPEASSAEYDEAELERLLEEKFQAIVGRSDR
jgi:acyl transferase domain-containing protein/acyl carrier protein